MLHHTHPEGLQQRAHEAPAPRSGSQLGCHIDQPASTGAVGVKLSAFGTRVFAGSGGDNCGSAKPTCTVINSRGIRPPKIWAHGEAFQEPGCASQLDCARNRLKPLFNDNTPAALFSWFRRIVLNVRVLSCLGFCPTYPLQA
jgi:hypothetical protein